MKLHSTDETVKMIYNGAEVVIYEGGWWMKKREYDKNLGCQPLGVHRMD